MYIVKSLRPYWLPVVTLVRDLLRLGWRVVGQVMLPTLSRKGNLLWSLFLLVTGLLERVIGFAEAVARVPRTVELSRLLGSNRLVALRLTQAWAYSRRYLRQGMLIAAWALFILSSFEWTSAPFPGAEATTVEQRAVPPSSRSCYRPVIADGRKEPVLASAEGLPVLPAGYPPPRPAPRWLLLRTLRI